MNEIIELDNKIVEDMIYEVRGVEVMLSSDVAKLYQVETKVLNQTIKRNINRFPKEFCFQLSNNEIDRLSLRSQFVTLNKSNNLRGQHYKYQPYALTEQGIMMLSGLLKSNIAVQVNIYIINAFVKMRNYIKYNEVLLPNRILLLEDKVDENTKKIKELFDKFDYKIIAKDYLFFKGDMYDAYSLILDIFNQAKKEIIIIDNYAGKELLDILKEINLKIIIISRNINETLKAKYESQYKNVTFVHNDSFHDRFIIIDKKLLYLCGSSFKDLGKKCFGISEFKDKKYLDEILRLIDNKKETI